MKFLRCLNLPMRFLPLARGDNGCRYGLYGGDRRREVPGRGRTLMLATLLLAHFWLQAQQGQVIWKRSDLPMEPNSPTNLMFTEPTQPIDPPKFSPKTFG